MIGYQLTRSDFDALHDILVDITGLDLGNIKADIHHWGLNDSVVRDQIYKYQSNQIP